MEGVLNVMSTTIRTPLKMQMLLHYYAIAEPYALREPKHANSEAVKEQREELIYEGMLEAVEGYTGYIVTEKARCYIAYILNNVEYPKQAWIME